MKRLILCLSLSCSIVPLPGSARTTGTANGPKNDITPRAVQGFVYDADDKAVQGAVVQIKDIKTLQVRSYVTQADGSYQFNGLSSNVEYELRAERQGALSSTKNLSIFEKKKLKKIDLKLKDKD